MRRRNNEEFEPPIGGPELAREFLLRTSLINSLREAARIAYAVGNPTAPAFPFADLWRPGDGGGGPFAGALAGIECFKQGGNVADACVAASAATAAVLGHAAGIGGIASCPIATRQAAQDLWLERQRHRACAGHAEIFRRHESAWAEDGAGARPRRRLGGDAPPVRQAEMGYAVRCRD